MQAARFSAAMCLLAASSVWAAKPVLRVNEDEISDVYLSRTKDAIRMQLRGQAVEEGLLTRHAADQAIGRLMLVQAAREAKVSVDPKEVEAAIARERAQFPTQEAFAKALADSGVTEQAIATYEEQRILVQRFLDTQIVPKIQVTDEEARAYYTGNPDQFKHAEQVNLRMILVPIANVSDAGADAAAKAKAEEALKRLKAGEEFAKLAAEYSPPQAAPNAGEIGWVRQGQLPAELDAAAFALKAGEVSGVVKASGAYRIFRADGRRGPGTSSFDEAKGLLISVLRGKALDKRVRDLVLERRSKAKVEILDPVLKDVLAPPKPAAQTPAAATPAVSPKPMTAKPVPDAGKH